MQTFSSDKTVESDTKEVFKNSFHRLYQQQLKQDNN